MVARARERFARFGEVRIEESGESDRRRGRRSATLGPADVEGPRPEDDGREGDPTEHERSGGPTPEHDAPGPSPDRRKRSSHVGVDLRRRALEGLSNAGVQGLGVLICERARQVFPSAAEVMSHRGARPAEEVDDLGHGAVLDEEQNEHDALHQRQIADRLAIHLRTFLHDKFK